MKRLLIASDSFQPRLDGVASFLNEVIPGLQQEYQITVVSSAWPGVPKDPVGVRVVRFPMTKHSFGDYSIGKPNLTHLNSLVQEADLVWTQTVGPIGFWSIMAAKRFKKPVAAFIHSLEWELFPKSVGKGKMFVHFFSKAYAGFAYRKCNLLMVPSLEIGELLTAKRIWTRKHIVPLGIDIQRFSPPVSKEESKQRIGLPRQFKVIGFVGRIAREKDLPTLAEAFRRVQRKHHRIKLVIVGDGLEEIKAQLKKDPHIIIVGAVHDVVPYLQAMDVFVLPSLTETSSLATLEAMACGLPVLCTPVGNIKKYIKDKRNGLLFPKGNALVLSLKLDWVLRNSFIREAVGKAGRKTVEEGFSWDVTIREIKEALASL
ncbi:MAG: glycosyltransferase family 4 protein [Nanoarchaeota archaeon]